MSCNVTAEELYAAVRQKAVFKDIGDTLTLEFTSLGMCLPPVEIKDDDDLEWYKSLPNEIPICMVRIAAQRSGCSHRRQDVFQCTNERITGSVRTVREFDWQMLDENINSQGNNLDNGFLETGMDFETAAENIINDWLHSDPNVDFAVGQIFMSKSELIFHLQQMALTKNFEYRLSRSSTTALTIDCIDPSCGWFVRSSKIGKSTMFKVRAFHRQHTCGLLHRCNRHRNASIKFIGTHIHDRVSSNNLYKPAVIMNDMGREFGIELTYWTAWKTREYAAMLERGPADDSYRQLPVYCYMLEASNPETVTRIKTDADNRFRYLFIAFGASIRGFSASIRLDICVDGTHLKATYRGILFTVTSQDANGHMFPIEWEIVSSETNDSWAWFICPIQIIFRPTTSPASYSEPQPCCPIFRSLLHLLFAPTLANSESIGSGSDCNPVGKVNLVILPRVMRPLTLNHNLSFLLHRTMH